MNSAWNWVESGSNASLRPAGCAPVNLCDLNCY